MYNQKKREKKSGRDIGEGRVSTGGCVRASWGPEGHGDRSVERTRVSREPERCRGQGPCEDKGVAGTGALRGPERRRGQGCCMDQGVARTAASRGQERRDNQGVAVDRGVTRTSK